MQNYFRELVSALIPAVIFWGILAVSVIRDRSRYRNCTFLLLAFVSLLPVIAALTGPLSETTALVLLAVLGILIIIVPILLIYNGFLMIKREGKKLKNLLSLFFGIFIAAGEVSALLIVILPQLRGTESLPVVWQLPLFMSILAVSAAYFSLCFLSFMTYTLFLQIIPRRRDFDYCIILGAGLLGGDRVSRLLSQRIDKAIEVWHKDPTPPIMIPSGGQGPDEKLPEGEAMADYLLAHGIPEESILIENRSRSTQENLQFSRKLIEEDFKTRDFGRAKKDKPYVAIVTSNYHVYRALRYARRQNFKATGIGSPVASYYWPSALIREFAAIHAEKKHAVIFAIGWILCLLPFILFALA